MRCALTRDAVFARLLLLACTGLHQGPRLLQGQRHLAPGRPRHDRRQRPPWVSLEAAARACAGEDSLTDRSDKFRDERAASARLLVLHHVLSVCLARMMVAGHRHVVPTTLHTSPLLFLTLPLTLPI